MSEYRPIIERTVTRYGCPYCGRTRSKRSQVAPHAAWCWKNPAARACGTCEHHIPPTRAESADWINGYPGSPGEPRACDAGEDNALAMPRDCPKWSDPVSSLRMVKEGEK